MNKKIEKKVAGTHDIATIMRDEFGVLVKDGEVAVRQVFQAIKIALEENDSVHIKGYLKINKNKIAKRVGRNPKTGESLEISEHYTLSYKSGLLFKSSLKND